MAALWDKGTVTDKDIIAFTVGDDREIDPNFATQDVLGSLAHVRVLAAAGLVSPQEAAALSGELKSLYLLALDGKLRPGPQDEDIHSTVERLLTAKLGDAGKRVHTARSRNDQVAVDVALWIRECALGACEEALVASRAAMEFGRNHAHIPMAGMTHLQPAMPTTVGLWALSYGSLLLDDVACLQGAFNGANACPLGSAAGFGVPLDLAPIDRRISAEALGFKRIVSPVNAVQGGRGKPEASLLFAMCQIATTCARFARDVVLFVNPSFGYLKLPDAFTTGSSIMPQKRNPDVMELVRAQASVVHASLYEVLTLSASVPAGYSRDFQLLKSPLLRGSRAARSALRMVSHLLPHIEVQEERCRSACSGDLYATHKALELVVAGVPFREAYKQVGVAVASGHLDMDNTYAHPSADVAIAEVGARMGEATEWVKGRQEHLNRCYASLLG